MEGIFTKNAYCKFDTDCTDCAPPNALLEMMVCYVITLRKKEWKNGISKQFEKLEAYGWEAAS